MLKSIDPVINLIDSKNMQVLATLLQVFQVVSFYDFQIQNDQMTKIAKIMIKMTKIINIFG